jgi:death on curing protein
VTEYLSLEDLLSLVDDLGVGPVRDVGLLDSAAHRPTAHLFGHEAYPGLDLKAAVLLQSLVGNHALVDGNKRLGWLATVVFYGLNDVSLDAPDDPAYELVMAVARDDVDLEQTAAALASWHR